MQEAFALWEERERARAEILGAVDEASASLARGEGRVITQQSMRDLAVEVKQRGRARLATEQTPDRLWCTVLNASLSSEKQIPRYARNDSSLGFLPSGAQHAAPLQGRFRICTLR